MQLNITGKGLLDPRELQAWTLKRQQQIREAVRRGMQSGGKKLVDQARTDIERGLKVKRKSFAKGMRHKVYASRPDRLPSMMIGSKVPWLGIHDKGGGVRGNLLIPLNVGRIGPKKFKSIITGLLRTGNAFFKKVNGKVILFAENISENTKELHRFRRYKRKSEGIKRVKRGEELPIAVLVKGVSLKKKINFTQIVKQKGVPIIVNEIKQELRR